MTPMHTLFLLAFLQASSEAQPMRSGCSADDALIATLIGQDQVEVQAARAGESDQTCYKIMLTRSEKVLTGYVLGEALPVVAAFVQRREKESADAAEALNRQAREGAAAQKREVAIKVTDPSVPSHFDDFSGAAPNGEPISLSSLRGRAILVTFWSPDNRPSMNQLISTLGLYNRLHESGLAAVGVSMNPDPSRIVDALDDVSLPWPQIADQSRIAKRYHIDPQAGQTFVLDASHNVVAAGVNGSDIEKAVRQLLETP